MLFNLTDSQLIFILNLILDPHTTIMVTFVRYKFVDLIVKSDFQIQIHIFSGLFIEELVKHVIKLMPWGDVTEASVCSSDCLLFD